MCAPEAEAFYTRNILGQTAFSPDMLYAKGLLYTQPSTFYIFLHQTPCASVLTSHHIEFHQDILQLEPFAAKLFTLGAVSCKTKYKCVHRTNTALDTNPTDLPSLSYSEQVYDVDSWKR